MWPSNTPANPSFIILKITPLRKTPDTTTVFDGGRWYAESPSSMGGSPVTPPISKLKEPMDCSTHQGYMRALTSDPITQTLITPRCACFQVLDPLSLSLCPWILSAKCVSITRLLVWASPDFSKKRYWIAAVSHLQHTVHICMLKTLTSFQCSYPKQRAKFIIINLLGFLS